MSQTVYPFIPTGAIARIESGILTPNASTQSTSEVSLFKLQITPKYSGNLFYSGKLIVTINDQVYVSHTWYFKVVDLFDNSIILNQSGTTSGDFTYTIILDFVRYFTDVSPASPVSLLDFRGYISSAWAGVLTLKQIQYYLTTIYGK